MQTIPYSQAEQREQETKEGSFRLTANWKAELTQDRSTFVVNTWKESLPSTATLQKHNRKSEGSKEGESGPACEQRITRRGNLSTVEPLDRLQHSTDPAPALLLKRERAKESSSIPSSRRNGLAQHACSSQAACDSMRV